MKYGTVMLLALGLLSVGAGIQLQGADNMASIAISPGTGAVTLVPRWGIGGNLAGFHHMAQDLSLGGGANQFYSIKATPIPPGGDIAAFSVYIAGSGAVTNHADIGSKLTPNSYSALTSADPDVGYGSVNFYLIHHRASGDYFSVIKPSSGLASSVDDLKPMSGPGGPGTLGASGYFGLTFAAADLNYGLSYFYYFRTDSVTGFTRFGTLDPALLGTATDKFDLGVGGHSALAFTGSDVGFGTNRMYFTRLDPITGFTIFGTLHPGTGRASDIANLGSIYSTLTFVPGDVGFGAGRFYTTGTINPTWQSVSFAAIDDRAISAGSFTVAPSASSALPIALTVVPGSVGAASISGPVGGVFTVRPTAPGLITLQATQAGQLAPTPYEYNMLRQSFTATGLATLAITTQPTGQSATAGTTATFAVVASGTSALSYQWRKAGISVPANVSATTATLSLPNVQPGDAGSYDVVVTNASGSIISNTVSLTVGAAAPAITNSPLTAGGTTGTPFNITITASGSPTSFTASPLPAGLAVNPATGAITGTPTGAGTTSVLLGATNATGTGNATLTVTIAAAGVAPTITNVALTPGGTVGSPFSYTITASGSPTSYSAAPLPAGLAINAPTGVISGTPTTAGVTSVLLGATNATGTGNATLTITVSAAGVAPAITNVALTPGGTVGAPFNYAITASGSPTSFGATSLPAGLVVNTTTGIISGTPAAAGVSSVLLAATNATGTGNATLTLTVAAAGIAPTITSSLAPATGTAGTPFSYTITAAGTPTSFTAAPLPAGLTLVPATGIITGTPSGPGTTTVALTATNATGTSSPASLVITVSPAPTPPTLPPLPPVVPTPIPTFTSASTATTTSGEPFSFNVVATGSPTIYGATGLPAGLVIDSSTGRITGTPSTSGTYVATLTAVNRAGLGTALLHITVSAAAAVVAPTITSPVAAPGTAGVPFVTYLIVATGSPTSYSATGLPPGLSLNTTTGAITGTPTSAGTWVVTLTASNAAGVSTSTLTLTIASAPGGPVITSPGTAAGVAGAPFPIYTIAGSGLHTSYMAKDLPPGLTLDVATGVISGTPTTAGTWLTTIQATNAIGTSTATVTISVAPTPASRIVNFSARAMSGIGSQSLIMGFVVSGNGKNLLMRGIGPGLTASGVVNVLADPILTVYGPRDILAVNDDWQMNSNGQVDGIQIALTATRVGAFALANGSKDAALLATFNNGAHTTSMLRTNGTTGVALTEIYDTDTTAEARLTNVSARMNVTGGEGTLIAGWVIAGNAPKTLLVRGIGPTLSSFGLTGVLADPQITIFSGGTAVASNDNWDTGTGAAAEVISRSLQVGAFALVPGSRDAALVVTLPPGNYTVQVVGVGNTTGVALVEIYDTP